MKHVSALVVSAFVSLSPGCEPEATPDETGPTIAATVFTPAGQVDCSAGCAIDLGVIAVGTARETPLIFTADAATVITDVERDGCGAFSIRVPGPFEGRSTTSIRLVAADAGLCTSTFSFVGDADNLDDVVIDVTATVEAAATDDDDVDDVPG